MINGLLYLIVLITLSALCRSQDTNQTAGIFNDKSECDKVCVGDHDLNCAAIKGGGPQHVCRCASSFYSVQQTCQDECENGQYWSLFTHGSCSEYNSNVLTGVCNKQCVFRFRTWTTVFIIVTFVAAVIIIIATLPNCIINCIACLRVRKHGRAIEDMQIAGDIGGGQSKSAAATPHPTQTGANPYQHGYYPYGYYRG